MNKMNVKSIDHHTAKKKQIETETQGELIPTQVGHD